MYMLQQVRVRNQRVRMGKGVRLVRNQVVREEDA